MRFFLASLLIAAPVFAQSGANLPAYCKTGERQIVRTYRPTAHPKYFFKPVGAQNEVAFVGNYAQDPVDRNFLFRLTDGRLTEIPGSLDPIGLYNTDLLSIPLDDGRGGLRMAFYDVRELRQHSIRTAPLLPPDETVAGRYQTMGVIERKGTQVRFRIITDGHDGGDYRDFVADFATTPAKLRPLAPVRPICKNLRDAEGALSLKLPMISKDAKYFSGFDVEKQEMRLYRLQSDGTCADPNIPSLNRGDIGKYDFSPDSSKIGFHYSDRSILFAPLHFGRPRSTWQLRSAIYDLKEQSYQLLPFFGAKINTYYPAFLPNGNVLTLVGNEEFGEFVEVDLSRLRKVSRETIEKFTRLSNQEFEAIQKLSQRWMNDCYDDVHRSFRAHRVLSLFALTDEQCRELAATDGLAQVCDWIR